MITISDQAAQALSVMLTQKNAPATAGLRLAVERGGCAGLQYAMQIGTAEPGDVTVTHASGVRFFIAADSHSVLDGSHVDYSDSLSDAGFKISNPNAVRACGCGTSFEPAPHAGVEPAAGQPCS